MTTDVAVVGAGVIGLSIAWRCAARGHTVRVYDPATVTGASHVAAGMLAPVGESTFGEEALTGLMVSSARSWPAFAAELHAASGIDPGYRADGTITVALTADDLTSAERLRRFQADLGLGAVRERASELRERESALTPRIRGGSFAAADHQVDPRRVVAALRMLVPVEGTGVTDPSMVDARTVVVAAGCATATLTGLPIRPVKGQIIRLRAPHSGNPVLRHVIRGYADGRQVYLVPRTDGEVVVGATEEERTDDAVTAGAVHDLLRAAIDLVPELAEYHLAETAAGHRPGTPDNAPIIGRIGGGTLVAAGHHRHGVLLAPVTAELIADLVDGAEEPEQWTPGRFVCA